MYERLGEGEGDEADALDDDEDDSCELGESFPFLDDVEAPGAAGLGIDWRGVLRRLAMSKTSSFSALLILSSPRPLFPSAPPLARSRSPLSALAAVFPLSGRGMRSPWGYNR